MERSLEKTAIWPFWALIRKPSKFRKKSLTLRVKVEIKKEYNSFLFKPSYDDSSASKSGAIFYF